MKAIPTEYRGRVYRSRLEARWACMFDLLGWKYEYEPYDLEGWIPDFAIYAASEILVEVKPYSKLEEFDTDKMTKALVKAYNNHEQKALFKTFKEILLVGSTLHLRDTGCPAIGWLGEQWMGPEMEEGDTYNFDWAIFNHYNNKWGFYHESGSWRDRITDIYEGNTYLNEPKYEEVLALWTEAGNKVQWRAPEVR